MSETLVVGAGLGEGLGAGVTTAGDRLGDGLDIVVVGLLGVGVIEVVVLVGVLAVGVVTEIIDTVGVPLPVSA